MLKTYRNILEILSNSERRKLYWLFFAILIMGLVQATGIVSIVPFMAIVSNPGIIDENRYLNQLYQLTGISTKNGFLFFFGFIVLALLVVGNAFSAFTTWQLLKYADLRRSQFSERLLIKYINQPYVFFLSKNTSDLAKNVVAEVNQAVYGVLLPGMQVIARSVVACFILSMILLVNPTLAIAVAIVLGCAYGGIYGMVRMKLARIGDRTVNARTHMFKAAGEALVGIKDLKLLGKEFTFVKRFAEPSRELAYCNAASQIIAQLPKYAIETLAFGGILLIIMYLTTEGKGVENSLPLVALYAFASLRLMPALQQIFTGLTTIKYNMPAMEILYNDLTEKGSGTKVLPDGADTTPALHFKEKLELRNIIFHYPSASDPTVNNLTITIEPNRTVGFIGVTGSGKTTIIDLLLGLLEPAEGQLIVDGVEVTQANVRRWQKNIGYVPQSIFLTDDTVRGNIALGVPEDEIDNASVEWAARMANLHSFIVNEMPDSYETFVGDRGIRLSGGQRQRIGIARALYNKPNVLILDEATSALDGITEGAIMDAFNNLAHKKTIIMIAHRLTTVEKCDLIYIIEKGTVIGKGTYSELIKTNSRFCDLAKVSQ